MARKIFLIIIILAFSLGSAKLSLALPSCNAKPSCCSLAGTKPCANAKQIPSSAQNPSPFGPHHSCSCELKKEIPSDSCDFAQQHREMAKTWKKLKFVSSISSCFLVTEKTGAAEENSSPPSLHQILSIQDSPLRC